MSTPDDLARVCQEIEEALEKATPGRWGFSPKLMGISANVPGRRFTTPVCKVSDGDEGFDNGFLIERLQNNARTLLDALKRPAPELAAQAENTMQRLSDQMGTNAIVPPLDGELREIEERHEREERDHVRTFSQIICGDHSETIEVPGGSMCCIEDYEQAATDRATLLDAVRRQQLLEGDCGSSTGECLYNYARVCRGCFRRRYQEVKLERAEQQAEIERLRNRLRFYESECKALPWQPLAIPHDPEAVIKPVSVGSLFNELADLRARMERYEKLLDDADTELRAVAHHSSQPLMASSASRWLREYDAAIAEEGDGNG